MPKLVKKVVRKRKFSKSDIEKLETIENLREELNRLETEMKVRTKEIGAGKHSCDGRYLTIKKVVRTTVSWRDVSYSLADEEKLNEIKKGFSMKSEYLTYKFL